MKKFHEDTDSVEWEDVPVLEADPDALVLNAGDLVQRWTNDHWVSPPHRVKKNSARYGSPSELVDPCSSGPERLKNVRNARNV